ncbi:hypothetical protein C8R47DRAFT_1229525 [Mycena vitilis]|nr:hypothetical protein C8R47DRAFT_1229525 [Mycena vitilis]
MATTPPCPPRFRVARGIRMRTKVVSVLRRMWDEVEVALPICHDMREEERYWKDVEAAMTAASASASSTAAAAAGSAQGCAGWQGLHRRWRVSFACMLSFTQYPSSCSDFINKATALGRSCDVQHSQCANVANSGKAFSVGECHTQNNACRAAIFK